MSYKRDSKSSENRFYAYIKWVLTAISGALTTGFIFLLGPVSS